MSETTKSQIESLAQQLALKIVSTVRQGVPEIITEAINQFDKKVATQRVAARDMEWATMLAQIFSLEEAPTDPSRIRKLINSHLTAREADLQKYWHDFGAQQAFKKGLQEGANLGWSGHSMNYTLEQVQEKAKDIKLK